MELWDAEFIDLLGPAYIQFGADGGSEFAFGTVQGGLDCHFGHGDGEAQLEEDGTLTGEIRFHRGDESSFTDRRW